jgi:hypothetical protein
MAGGLCTAGTPAPYRLYRPKSYKPEASNRAIATTLGVNEKTINGCIPL